jgi:4-hydroxyproline epimerase
MDWEPHDVEVIDSHTEGEPTRVVVSGGPDLGSGTAAEQLEVFRNHFDPFRRAVILEPRGSDVMVGAVLLEASDPSCAARVLFFDNVTFLGMCGHGTIGVVRTLAHLGRIGRGLHRLETPVGIVKVELHANESISINNVPSYRKATNIKIDVAGLGAVVGDVAWGGNWFYIVRDHQQHIDSSNTDQLTRFAWDIRQSINRAGYAQVDHIILLSESMHSSQARLRAPSTDAHSIPIVKTLRNFVLCPGKAYDRSQCGTGTSAILACLAADGQLGENEHLLQESVIESQFVASYKWLDKAAGIVSPTITGRAYVTAMSTLRFDPKDPFRFGIPASHSLSP